MAEQETIEINFVGEEETKETNPMSKTIKLIYNDKKETIPMFETYKECYDEYIKRFSIDEESAKNLNLFYYDADGDQTSFQNQTDYDIFIQDESLKEKIIEGEIAEKEKEEVYVEAPDPLKSAHLFNKNAPEEKEKFKLNLNKDSENLGISVHSVESIDNDKDPQKKNNIENNEIISKMNEIVNQTLEDKKKRRIN